MIVLHASALDGNLYLWGESPPEECPPEPKRRGRKPAKVPPPRSPFDPSLDRVIDALDPDFGLASQRFTAWLPAVGGMPVASSALVAPHPDGGATPQLSPVSVTAVRLSAPIACVLLGKCIETDVIAPGVLVGRSLAYWAAALRFAGALVVRQQYLPGIAVVDGVCGMINMLLSLGVQLVCHRHVLLIVVCHPMIKSRADIPRAAAKFQNVFDGSRR